MKSALMPALLCAVACTPATPLPHAVTVAEGQHQVIRVKSATMPVEEAGPWYAHSLETVVPALRACAGNTAVYVVRSESNGTAAMKVLSVWKSRADADRCTRNDPRAAADEEVEILFEAER
jgi:heme-degrading monooxygenase HmoA